jgi:hypothetical protein
MPTIRTPRGITPPAPGLDREEPVFVPEDDIPVPEAGASEREERPLRGPERE